MSSKSYFEKLKDPRWQRKRLEILERDDFTCRRCGDKQSTLNIHHIKYEKGEPWEIANEFLITLCEDCHETIQYNQKEFKLLIDSIPSHLTYDHYDEILEIVRSIMVRKHDPMTLRYIEQYIDRPTDLIYKELKKLYGQDKDN